MACCPTCRQEIPAGSRLVLDFERNIATAHGLFAYLTPDQMTLLRELHVEAPKIVRKEHLMQCLWSHKDWPDRPDKILMCQISRLRSIIWPLGLGILSEYGQGYRLLGRAQQAACPQSATIGVRA